MKLIVTSCIEPNTNLFVSVDEPKVRLAEYVDVLKYTIAVVRQLSTPIDIVFVDCSKSQHWLYQIRDIIHQEMGVGDGVRFLWVDAGDANDRGKGYNEVGLIKAALWDSARGTKSSYFVKLSGRYRILNLKQIIRRAAINDYRILCERSHILHRVHTVCFCMSGDIFASKLNDLTKMVDDSRGRNFFLEAVMYRTFEQDLLHANTAIHPKLSITQKSGSNGRRYDGLKGRARDILYSDLLNSFFSKV